MSNTLLHRTLSLLFIAHATCETCIHDIAGSYGDPRELNAGAFAQLVGLACSSTCYTTASKWSTMAIQHGNSPVTTTDACRSLCATTPGCEVWTHDHYKQTCRAMRTSTEPPALSSATPNTTTGRAVCADNSIHFLPFPDSLTRYVPSDVDDKCWRPGFLYGDGDSSDAECSTPPPRASLLAVHTTQAILDMGTAQGWWEDLTYADPNNAKPTTIELVPTPNSKPFTTALLCAKACQANTNNCGGFSFTHGVCLLRGQTHAPTTGNFDTSLALSCRATNAAVRSDALTGASFVSTTEQNKCSRLERTIPQPATNFFDRCDVPRCTELEDANTGEFFRWDLDAPFESGTRDFAYNPGGNGKCYFPVYNRTEIRTLLGGQGAAPGNEAWAIMTGGSNSYGMGGAVMRAVHNSGGEDTKLVEKVDPATGLTILEGRGISEKDKGLSQWGVHCLVDSIRFPDGRTIVRAVTNSECGQPDKGWDFKQGKYSDNMVTTLTAWLKEMDQYFVPGAIRVTHVGNYYMQSFAEFTLVAGNKANNFKWKKLLMWGHNIQRTTSSTAVIRDLTFITQSEVCNRPGETFCAVGTKYPANNWVPLMQKLTYPNSPVHLLDVAHVFAVRGGTGFEFNNHALQSLHVLMFQMLLNSWDLEVSLSTKQRARAVAAVGCPEAVRLPKRCNSAGPGPWTVVNGFLCDFDRDEITPKSGMPAFQAAREPLLPVGGGGNSGTNSGGGGGSSQIESSGICGTDVPDFSIFDAIQAYGNRSQIASRQKKVALAFEDAATVRPMLCKGRLWCGYETQAWALGVGMAFLVGVWWTIKQVLMEIKRDQGSEVQRLNKINDKAAATAATAVTKQPRQRRASLDPGNGGARNNKKQHRSRNRRSIVSRKELGLAGSQSNKVVSAVKPLSTAVGERLTSLGPARFLASMHIVAGHLYQKSALGPLFFLSWGYTWVPWFFMLSGYVLMHARLNSRTPNRVDTPMTALWKRTSSIFPMYTVGVVLDMLCFCVRGTPLPAYHVLIAQSFLLQSWLSFFTEKALQTHCWFLSAMVVYWLTFGPTYRFIRKLSLGKTLGFMCCLGLLPWLAVIIPSALNDLAFYKNHRTGSLTDEDGNPSGLDHLVVTLKFNPICYFHVFLFGMCLANFRRHVTRREDSYETTRAPRPSTQAWLLVPFRAGAVMGYLSIFITFLSLREASAAQAKISARLGLLMPLQGLILLGLSPLRGLARDVSDVQWFWQQTGADPIANLFHLAPGWIGDVSYAQYVLQILAYTVWPMRLDVFGRFGWIPFFLFLLYVV